MRLFENLKGLLENREELKRVYQLWWLGKIKEEERKERDIEI
jgi:hypothetical protein